MNLKAKRIDLEAGDHVVVLNKKDAERLGLRSQARVKITKKDKKVTAIIETSESLVGEGCAGLLKRVYDELEAKEDEELEIVQTGRPDSIDHIKEKLEGEELSTHAINEIIEDIVAQKLSDIELSAYVSGLYSQGMTQREMKDLTEAMFKTGDTIEFDVHPIFDHHSIGGVPGNKITLIIVPIVAAAGLTIPKTSSRAISSAGGTADIFEVLADVKLSTDEIKRIAEEIGGTIAWGGAVNLAPSDDMIIRAEYPLRIDPYPQVIASVLSKKKAIGAEYLVMDIPVGTNTKVEDMDLGRRYARDFVSLGEEIGIEVRCALSYGGQPVGRAIGPALEAKEALKALEGKEVPSSLIEKSTSLAGMILEQGGFRDGKKIAKDILTSGKALEKMKEIIEHQGGNSDVESDTVEIGRYEKKVRSNREGYVNSINNNSIIQIARNAGAPHEKGAGFILHKKNGDKVNLDEPLYTIYSEHEQKLDTAVKLANHLKPLKIEGMIIEKHPEIQNI